MKLKGRAICMPVAHEFEDVELLFPLLRLSEEGARIVIGTYRASFSARPYVGNTKPITGRLGYPVPPVPMVEGRRFELADMLTLKPEDFQRRGVHSKSGPLTLEAFVERSTRHIPHHVRFIEEKRKALAAG